MSISFLLSLLVLIHFLVLITVIAAYFLLKEKVQYIIDSIVYISANKPLPIAQEDSNEEPTEPRSVSDEDEYNIEQERYKEKENEFKPSIDMIKKTFRHIRKRG